MWRKRKGPQPEAHFRAPPRPARTDHKEPTSPRAESAIRTPRRPEVVPGGRPGHGCSTSPSGAQAVPQQQRGRKNTSERRALSASPPKGSLEGGLARRAARDVRAVGGGRGGPITQPLSRFDGSGRGAGQNRPHSVLPKATEGATAYAGTQRYSVPSRGGEAPLGPGSGGISQRGVAGGPTRGLSPRTRRVNIDRGVGEASRTLGKGVKAGRALGKRGLSPRRGGDRTDDTRREGQGLRKTEEPGSSSSTPTTEVTSQWKKSGVRNKREASTYIRSLVRDAGPHEADTPTEPAEKGPDRVADRPPMSSKSVAQAALSSDSGLDSHRSGHCYQGRGGDSPLIPARHDLGEKDSQPGREIEEEEEEDVYLAGEEVKSVEEAEKKVRMRRRQTRQSIMHSADMMRKITAVTRGSALPPKEATAGDAKTGVVASSTRSGGSVRMKVPQEGGSSGGGGAGGGDGRMRTCTLFPKGNLDNHIILPGSQTPLQYQTDAGTGEVVVAAGSCGGLVHQLVAASSLTLPERFDMRKYEQSFFTTHPLFMRSFDLLGELIYLYNKSKSGARKQRIVELLQHWVEEHSHHFREDPQLRLRFKRFVSSLLSSHDAGAGSLVGAGEGAGNDGDGGDYTSTWRRPSQTRNLPKVEKPMARPARPFPQEYFSRDSSDSADAMTPSTSSLLERLTLLSRKMDDIALRKTRTASAAPAVSLRKGAAKLKPDAGLLRPEMYKPFQVLSPEVLAGQICLFHHGILEGIMISELRDEAWNKNPENAPNVVEMIQRFNELSFWLQTVIVSNPTAKARARCLGSCIKLGRCLRIRKDYHGVMAVLSALSSSAIQRLKASWAELSADKWRIFDNLNVLFDPSSNLARYRRALAAQAPPGVPYLGTIVGDLTIFLEVSDFVAAEDKSVELVNYSKMQSLGKIFGTIRKFQSQQYRVEPIESIQAFFASDESTRPAASILSESDIYDCTLKLEPRGEFQGLMRKNAKGMAGFLAKRRHMHSQYHS